MIQELYHCLLHFFIKLKFSVKLLQIFIDLQIISTFHIINYAERGNYTALRTTELDHGPKISMYSARNLEMAIRFSL